MNLLTKLCLNPVFAPQFRKPGGPFGLLVSKVMRDINFFVYTGIEQFADFSENHRVMEIGYGPGVGINYYLSKYKIVLDGIDYSRMMHAESSRRNKKYIQNGSLNLYHADFETFPLAENSYDQVILRMSSISGGT